MGANFFLYCLPVGVSEMILFLLSPGSSERVTNFFLIQVIDQRGKAGFILLNCIGDFLLINLDSVIRN